MDTTTVVRYADFGAVGNGITDDASAIAAAHYYANQKRLPVEAEAGATYYIGDLQKTIAVQTDTDWNGAQFILDDTKVSYRSKTRGVDIFTVLPDTPETKLVPPAGMTLKVGQTNLGMTFASPCLVLVENAGKKDYVRFGINASGGKARQEYLLVDEKGNVDPSTPIQYDYEAVTGITVYSYTDTSVTLKNAIFKTIACDPIAEDAAKGEQYLGQYYYYARGLCVCRSHTTLVGIEHYVSDHVWEEGGDPCNGGAPYVGFYTFCHAADITVKNCVATGHREYNFKQKTADGSYATNGMGSYDVNATGAVNLSFFGFRQSNNICDKKHQHGLFGTNYCRNVLLEDCYIDRFDAHSALHNVTIRNTTIGFGLYLMGGGKAYFENVTRLSENMFVYLRDDYGATWHGDIILKNCHFDNPTAKYVVLGFWRSFDFGLPCHMGYTLTVDNLQFNAHALSAYFILWIKENSLTDPVNPFFPPKAITVRRMKRIALADETTAVAVNERTVETVVWEDVTD